MKSQEEIEKRRDVFAALAKDTSSRIDELDILIKKCPSNWQSAHLVKEKESLQTVLGIANNQWAELMWVLEQ